MFWHIIPILFIILTAYYIYFCIFWKQISWIILKCCRRLWPLQMQRTKWCTTEHIAQYGHKHKQSVGSKIYLNGTKTRFFIWPGGLTNYTANMCSEITVRTQLKTVKLNHSFFTVKWTSILPYIVQCRSVYSSLQLLHCTWSSNQM